MKTPYSRLTCLLVTYLFFNTGANAQAVDANPSHLKQAPANIIIDGDLKDWNDSLQYFNAENNLRYTLSNDHDNLYFAARVTDPYEIARVLKAGITLSVDPKGKKKTAYNITFPLNVSIGSLSATTKPENMSGVTQEDRDDLVRQMATTLRGIKTEGFKDIEGDMITTSNTYGIKTALNYDEKGNLIIEASVALKLLHADPKSKTEWLYDIKINGVARPSNLANSDTSPAVSSGRGGRGGGGGGGFGGGGGGRGGKGGGARTTTPTDQTPGASSLAKISEFSGKFTIAAIQ